MDDSEREELQAKIKRLEQEICSLKPKVEKQRKLEQQLLHAQKMEALACLSAGIAHDFNNILQCILGYTQIAVMDKTTDHPDYDTYRKIESMVKKGGRLTDRFLAFGRKIALNPTPVNLNSIVTELKTLLRRTIPKMIGIELDLTPDLKLINADVSQCEQILMNLCINARDAMGEKGRLNLRTENIVIDGIHPQTFLDSPPGEYVRLTVEDTGTGMAPETIDHIFEPFFTTKTKGKGTGLGLSMVYSIVKNHGGFVECTSRKSVGTSFRIYFPVRSSTDLKTQPVSREEPENSIHGNETILIVDDETDLLQISKTLLQEHGYKIFTAKSGEEGLHIYAFQHVDLVLLDLGMPGMGGSECLKNLRLLDPGAKTIIVSGYSSDHRADEVLRSGATAFLTKPYDAKDILLTVRSVLDGKPGNPIGVVCPHWNPMCKPAPKSRLDNVAT